MIWRIRFPIFSKPKTAMDVWGWKALCCYSPWAVLPSTPDHFIFCPIKRHSSSVIYTQEGQIKIEIHTYDLRTVFWYKSTQFFQQRIEIIRYSCGCSKSSPLSNKGIQLVRFSRCICHISNIFNPEYPIARYPDWWITMPMVLVLAHLWLFYIFPSLLLQPSRLHQYVRDPPRWVM